MTAPRLSLSTILLAAGLVACGSDDERLPPIVDAAPPGLDASLDASSGRCGGILGETCAAGQYCDFPLNSCGATDEQGSCKPRPTSCPDTLVAVPTCGCDGTVYSQDCEAYMAGADLNALGSCPVPEGLFACGYTQCSIATQYCARQVSDIGDEPDSYACLPLPWCSSEHPTCACLASEPCGAQCSGEGVTGLTLTCPGG